jgi:hypothetical protein
MITLTKGRAAVAVLAVVTFLGTGAVVTSDDARGQNAAASATGAHVREKAQARARAAEKVLAALEARVQAGDAITVAFLDLQAGWMRRLAEARIDATDDSAARVRAAEQHVQKCRDMQAMLERRKGQDVSNVQLAQGEYHLADAEYLLAKMQGK